MVVKGLGRRPLVHGVASLTIVLFALVLLECGARLLRLAPPLPNQWSNYVRDPFIPFKPRPYSRLSGRSISGEFDFDYLHNSFGLRDSEHAVNKPVGYYRILGLGDSFTYGAGVSFEDSFLCRVERMFNERPCSNPRVEVIKAGIPRFFPEAERMFLEHYGVRFNPDLILVVFHPNDVIDTYFGVNAMSVTKNGGYLMTREAGELGEIGIWLYMHSDAMRIVLSKYVAFEINRRHPVYWSDIFMRNGRHEESWKKIESEYERIVVIARGMNVPVVFINIPMKPPWVGGSAYPADRLSEWCERQGVSFIDVLPAMKRSPSSGALYWKRDGHCTAEGEQVIAEAVYAELGDSDWLQCRQN